ncbi:Protein kinase domain protein [Legionella massiliensis]|uniref:Protein kinase domain protein n=1 Tax=Legionella massiliensis TaxID=1034943 RepID=A0A078KVV1_9GAMM|nr:protein kinase family protein [Legionella massiliensis]CDZ77137.1 Protein kinase domain protein [Legionella massiliensis]CEE12875.1 Protein kinase domain protein [Legionella massiliensis]
MGKSGKQSEQIELLKRAFLGIRFDGQENPDVLTRKIKESKSPVARKEQEDDTFDSANEEVKEQLHPFAQLIETDTLFTRLEEALAEKMKKLTNSTKKPKITHLGGSSIPIFLVKFKEASVIFRLLPDGAYIDAYKGLQEGGTQKHLPKQHLLESFQYKQRTRYFELLDYCEQGSLEKKAQNHAELIKDKQALLLKYAINIMQIMVDFRKAGVVFPDIKPSNFLVTSEGDIVISDVKSLLGVRDKPRVPHLDILRTPIYESGGGLNTSQSIESESSRSSTVNIDSIESKSKYAVGITLYELATGHMVAAELGEKKKVALDAKEEAAFNHQQAIQKSKGVADAQAELQKKEQDLSDINAKTPRSEMDLDHEVFKKGVGATLKTLILSLTDEQKANRIGFTNALQQLSVLLPPSPTPKSPRKKSFTLSHGEASSSASPTSSSASLASEVASSSEQQDESIETLQSPREKKKRESSIDKKRGFFGLRTFSTAAVKAEKQQEESQPELGRQIAELQSAIKKKRTNSASTYLPLKATTSSDPLMLRDEAPKSARSPRPGKEEAKRDNFRRKRTASTPAVVDIKIKSAELANEASALVQNSVFGESARLLNKDKQDSQSVSLEDGPVI